MKVFQINFTVSIDRKVNTNILKASINGLLQMGKDAKVVSFTFVPYAVNGLVNLYLYKKSGVKLYNGEMIILVKGEKFADGKAICPGTLQNRLTDAIPCITDKKTGEPMGVEPIDIKVKKL